MINFACEDGVECHGVECVEKPGGWIVHELNVSEVVCAGVECVGVEKVKSGVESKSWISRSGVVPLPSEIAVTRGTMNS
jgi:hypothetical protein